MLGNKSVDHTTSVGGKALSALVVGLIDLESSHQRVSIKRYTRSETIIFRTELYSGVVMGRTGVAELHSTDEITWEDETSHTLFEGNDKFFRFITAASLVQSLAI